MTLRYAGADQTAQRWRLGVALLTVAAVGGLCAVGVHYGCLHPPPPVIVPDPGTPRGTYCSAVIPAKPWIVMVLIPCAFVALVGLAARTRRALWLWAAVTCLLLVANVIAANSLSAALTV